MEIWLDRIIPGIVRLLICVSIGVFVGSLLDSMGWLRQLSFLAAPLRRVGGLPPQCYTAFITAFASPRAANGILSGAYDQELISRRQMIAGALVNTFPNSLSHVRIMAFAIIPLAGYAGAAYVCFQMLVGVGCSLAAVVGVRIFVGAGGEAGEEGEVSCSKLGFREAVRKAYKHARKVLLRIVVVTVPLYIVVSYLDKMGVFAAMADKLPPSLSAVLPPAALAILVGHMTNILTAASAASELLQSQTMGAAQVFLTFLIGYGLTIPIRAVRHSIPAAVGVFPAKDGLTIVLLSSGLRLFFTVVAIVLTIMFISGGMLG